MHLLRPVGIRCATRVFALLCCNLLVAGAATAQSVWSDLSGRALPDDSPYAAAQLAELRHLRLDAPALSGLLQDVTREGDAAADEAEKTTLLVPQVDGTTRAFALTEYALFTDGYRDDVRAFYGHALDDASVRLRAEYTPEHGLRVQVNAGGRLSFVEPVALRAGTSHYIAFRRDDIDAPRQPLACGFDPDQQPDEPSDAPKDQSGSAAERSAAGDCTFRSYRLAIATTAEYSAYFGATSAAQSNLVLAGVTTTVNRVNGIFETESAVRLQLLGNTANSFYYDANNDPYTDGNAGQMLNANTPALNGVYGSGGYDVGHVFGAVGGNGVAYLRSVCGGSKGGGVTLRNNPVGDPFDVDYVAHEIGHQFGGNHTQNNACNRSGVSYEPGSASTIMGYAGICAPNVQNNSDAYFHAASLAEIAAFVTGSGNACATALPSLNNAPTVLAGASVTIPHGTPFALTANGNDPDGDPLTYQWEHYDDGVATMPPSPQSTTGPNFRSLTATASPTRYFPAQEAVRTGVADTWEVLPAVARSSTFRVTARDNQAGGCTDEADLTVTWANSGPFAVTSPSGSSNVWVTGQPVTVTWSLGGSDAAPISCGAVDILLSTDDGFTYATTLATAAPNTGAYTFTLPAGTPLTTQARVLVECSSSVFYSVSPQAFEISDVPSAIACQTVASTNVPLGIGPNAGTVTTSTLNVSAAQPYPITSVRVLGLQGEHTYVGDLTTELTSPDATAVRLFDAQCGFRDDFDLGFSAAGAAYNSITCPLTGGQVYQPLDPFDALLGGRADGTWTLTITDNADQDGGQLQAWSLEVCYDQLAALPAELLAFSASPRGPALSGVEWAKTDHIALAWTTGAEVDFDHFVVERLVEGARLRDNRFEPIGRVAATGGGSEYAFADREAVADVTQYYRLRQVDRDGGAELSDVVSARLEGRVAESLSARWVGGSLRVNVRGPQRVEVLDVQGRLVYAGELPGGATDVATTETWASGVYVVRAGSSAVRVYVP